LPWEILPADLESKDVDSFAKSPLHPLPPRRLPSDVKERSIVANLRRKSLLFIQF
jgi:hypothetical protein